jgi:hypothetical protein
MPSDKKYIAVIVTIILVGAAIVGSITKLAYKELATIKKAQTQEAHFLLSTLDFKTEQQKIILFIRDQILTEWARINYKKGNYDRAYGISSALVRESLKYPYMPVPDMALLMAAMLKQESSFMDSAISSHGATGIAQFMPSTARIIARILQVEYSDTLLFNPEVAVRFQGAYLDIILSSHKYVIEPSLAEYNGGTWSAIYWKTDHSRLSPETKAYVPEIMQRFRGYQKAYKTYQVSLAAAKNTDTQ